MLLPCVLNMSREKLEIIEQENRKEVIRTLDCKSLGNAMTFFLKKKYL